MMLNVPSMTLSPLHPMPMPDECALLRIRTNDRCGFIDYAGDVRILPKYREAQRSFSNGRAFVEIDGIYGYIDCNDNIIIAPQFQQAKDFTEGIAAVKIDGKWGYINVLGQTIVPPQFDDAGLFVNGIAIVGTEGKTSKLSHRVLDTMPNIIYARLSLKGMKKAKDSPRMTSSSSPLPRQKDEGDKWGYIDHAGKWIVPPKYDGAQVFSEGLAAVYMENHWIYIDVNGRAAFSHTFSQAFPFENGIAAVVTKNGWGYIRSNGEWLWEPTK
jgi:hypothetical protein